MAWAIASGIKGNDSAGKERKYQQEQARIDLELLQIKSDAAAGNITGEIAQIRTEQWVANNYTRFLNQAALAAELDQISPLAAGTTGKANGAESPFPARTPEAAQYRKWEEAETLAMASIPQKASPEERQRLTDLWAQSKEGAAILGEKRKLLTQENQRRSALPPPAAVSLRPAPDFHHVPIRLEPSIRKLPAPKHHAPREMGHPAHQYFRSHPAFRRRCQSLSYLLRKPSPDHRSILPFLRSPLSAKDRPVKNSTSKPSGRCGTRTSK